MTRPHAELTDAQNIIFHFQQAKQNLLSTLEPSAGKVVSLNQRQRLSRFQKHYSKLVDQTLCQFWQIAQISQQCTLIAVAGYGRHDLFPYSDIDTLILTPDNPSAEDKQGIEKFNHLCWDANIGLAPSTRSLAHVLTDIEEDVTFATCLLETRFLCGSEKDYDQLTNAFFAQLNPKTFFNAKQTEQQQRYAQHQNTAYALEPNCKESPGGLRDLHTILWLAKACQLGHSWESLRENGVITEKECAGLIRHENRLKNIRLALHIFSKHDFNGLQFDQQIVLASHFGITASKTLRDSERLMRQYYRTAKAVSQLNIIVLQQIKNHLFKQDRKLIKHRVLDQHFVVYDGVLDIIDPLCFSKHPQAILQTFVHFSQEREINELSSQIFRGLFNARGLTNMAWRQLPSNRKAFMQIIQGPKLTRTIRLMNNTSILGRYLRNFGRIVGQMQHDLFHVYTVDQHTLMVLRNVRRFIIPEHVHEFPFCSELMANFAKLWVLYLAAIFHDIAKGRGGDHSFLGMRDAKQFCKQHDISLEDTELIVWLVKMHLQFSHTAQKQDTSDIEVIEKFAKLMKDERHLTALYLLTVADVRGTSPKVWSDWKGKLFEDLYKKTRQRLNTKETLKDSWLTQQKNQSKLLLGQVGLEPHHYQQFWQQLDVEAFFKFEPELITWITKQLWNKVNDTAPQIKCQVLKQIKGLQVMVYAPDAENFFARICLYFQRLGLSVSHALIQTTTHDYALDIFQVLDTAGLVGENENYRQLMSLIEYELTQFLAQASPLPPPKMGRLPRQSQTFPLTPKVFINSDEAKKYYLLEISTADRTGLLYTVAHTLAQFQIDLHSARINTLGERAEDVFMLSANTFAKHKDAQGKLVQALLSALTH